MKSFTEDRDSLQLDTTVKKNTPSKTDHAKDNFSWKKAFHLIKDYFLNSDEKFMAWLLLFGIIISVIAFVGLMIAFSWWSAGFWAALTAKIWIPFLISIGKFCLLVSGVVLSQVLKNYQIGVLSILWRNWLSKKWINELFTSENNFLELSRTNNNDDNKIDNIEQRIQDDIKSMVESTLNLGADFLKAILTLGAFAGTLWIVGGALSVVLVGLNIVIPGYMLWVALIIAITVTVITYCIGKSLAKTTEDIESTEADLRQDIKILNDEAENIALENAQDYYHQAINIRLDKVSYINYEKLNTESQLITFQSIYTQAATILPYLAAVPLYFTGTIQFAQIMQIGMAFGQVSDSFNWFANNYQGISQYKASLGRLLALQDKLNEKGNSKFIIKKEKNIAGIKIKNLSIRQPQASDTQYMMRHLNLELHSEQNILIQAPSGIGKSTLFKAISGTWEHGEGVIVLPAGKRRYCLPQKPHLPQSTLKSVLAYPEPVGMYKENEYKNALIAVGGMDKHLKYLENNEIQNWSKLSGGEKQRISFARALLKKPDWLFLDEATSALDNDSEHHLYNLLLKELKNTTIVSIAHRDSVRKFHTRVIFFAVNDNQDIAVIEQPNSITMPP